MSMDYQAYQPVPGSRIVVGTSDAPGHERPESLIVLNVVVRPSGAVYGTPTGEPMEVALALTVPQMAEIVMHFFSHVARGVYASFFRRLMEHRYAMMTSSVIKSPILGGDAYETMRYHKHLSD